MYRVAIVDNFIPQSKLRTCFYIYNLIKRKKISMMIRGYYSFSPEGDYLNLKVCYCQDFPRYFIPY